MGQQIAVSFEDEQVRVLYASIRKGQVVIDKTLVFSDAEFDHFLAAEKSRSFIVVCRFKAFYSDTLTLPPAKDRYLGKMVESEIRKRYPECKDFSYFFSVLGTKEAAAKPAKDVFFFAADNLILNEVLDRFSRHGKQVSYLFPDVLALAQFVRSSENVANKSVLCLSVTDTSKTLFLMKNCEVCFIRVTQSMGRDIQEMDLDNIHMTVSYCRQSLRQDPQQLYLVNVPRKADAPPLNTILPAMPVSCSLAINACEDTIREFIAPISAVMAAEKLKASSLLPHSYRTLQRQKALLAAGISLFLLLGLLGLGYLTINVREVFFARDKVKTMRMEALGMEAVLSAYHARSASLQQSLTYVNALNAARSAPNAEQALALLGFLPMPSVKVNKLQLRSSKESLVIQVSGSIAAKTFADLHVIYQGLLDNIKNAPGMTVSTEHLDLRDGGFETAIEYKAQ